MINFIRHFRQISAVRLAELALVAGVVMFVALAPKTFAAAGIYRPINYQGKLSSTGGLAITNGQYNMRFKIFTQATGGVAAWTETWNGSSQRVTSTGGLFSIALGTHTTMTGSVDFNSDSLYLQVEFDPGNDGTYEEIFAPRRRFASVPYAHNANTLDGLDSTQFIRADQSYTASGTITIRPRTAAKIGIDIISSGGSSATGALRLSTQGAPAIIFGSGGLNYDTNLYRASSHTLKTDDALQVVGTLSGSRLVISGNAGITGALLVQGNITTRGTLSGYNLTVSRSASISGTLIVRTGITSKGSVSGSTIDGFGLGSCTGTFQRLLYNSTTDKFECGSISTASSFGTGNVLTIGDARYVRKAGDTMTGALTIRPSAGVNTIGLNVAATMSGRALFISGTGATALLQVSPQLGSVLFADGTLQNPALAFANNPDTGFVHNSNSVRTVVNGTQVLIAGSTSLTTAIGGGISLRLGSAGTESAPSYSFETDENTGLYRVTADTLGISTAGSERLRINSIGNVGIGTTNPRARLEVAGSISGASLFVQSMSGAGLTDCSNINTSKLLWNVSTRRFSCASDLNTGTFGTGNLLFIADGRYVKKSGDTMTGALVIDLTGGNSQTLGLNVRNTISGSRLIVSGNASVSGALIVRNNIFTSGTLSGRNLTLSNSASISGTLIVRTSITSKGSLSGATIAGFNLGSCNSGSQKLLYNNSTQKFECGTDRAGTSTGNVLTIGDARYLRRSGGTMTGQLVVDITGGNFNTVGLKVINTTSGAHLHAESTLTSSGIAVIETLSSIRGSGALTLMQNAEFGTGAYLYSSGTVLALDTFSARGDTKHILFGYRGVFDTNLYRSTTETLRTDGSLIVRNLLSGSNLTVSRSASISGTLIVKTGITSKGSVSGSTIDGFGLGSCNGASQRLLYNSTTDKFECGTISTASTFGTGNVLTIGDARYLRRSGGTMTGQLVVDITGGNANTIGLKVINTLSGANIHAEKSLTSSGSLVWEGTASGNALRVMGESYFMGNLGIGDPTPASKLSLAAPAGSNAVEFGFYNDGGTTKIGSIRTDNNLKLVLDGYSTGGVYMPTGLSLGTYASGAPPTGGAIISGNVGIGTNNPRANLEVAGAISGTTLFVQSMSGAGLTDCDAARSTLRWDVTTRRFSCGATAGFSTGAVLSIGDARYVRKSGDTMTGTLILNPQSGLALNARGTISGALITQNGGGNNYFLGNLGVGTVNPQNKLDVRGTFRVSDYTGAVGSSLKFLDNGAGAGVLQYSGSASSLYVTGPINTAFLIRDGATPSINLGTYSNTNRTRVIVDGSMAIGNGYDVGGNTPPTNGLIVEGNVGVGAATPKSKLDVVGTISGSRLVLSGNAGITGALLVQGNITTRGTLSGYNLTVSRSASISGTLIVKTGITSKGSVSGSTIDGFGLGACTGTFQKLLYNSTTDKFECGTISTASTFGTGNVLTIGDARYLRRSGGTMTGQLVVDITNGALGTVGLKVVNTISGGVIRADKLLSSSGTLLVKNGSALVSIDAGSFSGSVTIGHQRTIALTRPLPGTINDAVNIGSFNCLAGAGACTFDISVVVSQSSYSISKRYIVSTQYALGQVYQKALPISSSGPYGANDFDLDIESLNGLTTMRLRRTVGSGSPTAYVTIVSNGLQTFTPSTSVTSVTAPTHIYETTSLTQYIGRVGIGVATPTANFEASGSVILNSANTNSNITMKGMTDSSLFVMNAAANSIGIGTASPKAKLDIVGTLSGARLVISNNANISGALLVVRDLTTRGTISGYNLTVSRSASISGTLIVKTGITSKGSVSGSTIDGFGLGSCNGASQRLLYNSTTDKFECGTIATTSTFGTGNVLTIGDARYLRRSGGTMTGALVVDITGGNSETLGLNVRNTISGSRLIVSGHASVSGSLLVRGALTSRSVISGASIVSSGNANIFGNLTSQRTISGSRLIISGHSNISGSLLVRGALTSRSIISGASIISSGNTNVYGNFTTLRTISGSRLVVSGHANISGALIVRNNIFTSGTLSGRNLTLSNSASISGTLIVRTGITSKGSVSGSTIDGFGLGACTGTFQKLMYNATTDKFECGAISTASTFGTGNVLRIGDARYVRKAGDTMTGALIVDITGGNPQTLGLNVRNTISGSRLVVSGHANISGALIVRNNIFTSGTLSGRNLTLSNSASISGTLIVRTGITSKGSVSGSTIDGFGLGSCNGASQRLLYNSTTDKFECGTISASGTFGTGNVLTIGDARYVRKAGDTMTGALTINITGGNFNTIGLRVINTLSGAHLHAERTLTSSGVIVVRQRTIQGSGALTLEQTANSTGAYLRSRASSNPLLVLDTSLADSSAAPHILFGYSGFFDVSLFRSANQTLSLSGHLVPAGTNLYDLGSNTKRWRDLYLSGGTLHLGAAGDQATLGFNSGANRFDINTNTDTTPEFVILDSGNIGIGTSTPEAKLEVVGNLSGSRLVISNNANISGALLVVRDLTTRGTLSGSNLTVSRSASISGTLIVKTGITSKGSLSGSTIDGFGLGSCNGASQRLLYNSTTDKFECGTISASGTFGTGNVLTIGDARYLRRSGGTMTGVLTVDITGGNFNTIGLRVINTLSGAHLHAERLLTSSGTIVTESGANIASGTFYVDGVRNRVGINTTTPDYTLTISGSTANMLRIHRGTSVNGAAIGAAFSALNSSSVIKSYASINAFIESSTAGSENGSLRFHTVGAGTSAEHMRITSVGDVGIGSTAPKAKLDVAGTISGALITQNGAGNNYFMGRLGIGTMSPDSYLDIEGPATTSPTLRLSGGDGALGFTGSSIALGFRNSSSDWQHWIHTRHNNLTSLNNAIDFYTNDGTQTGVFPANGVHGLTINGGRVGVGTTIPRTRFEVIGSGTFIGTMSGLHLVVSRSATISGTLLVKDSITSKGSVSGSSLFGFGLGNCSSSSKKLTYNNSTGKFSCQDDLTAASGLEYSTAAAIFVNQSGDTMTGALVIDLTGGNPLSLGLNVRNTISGSRLIVSGHASVSGSLLVVRNLTTRGTLSGSNLTVSRSASISGTLIVKTGITSKGSVSGSTIDGFGLGSCNGGSQRLLYNATTDKFECGTISATSSFGTGNVIAIGDARYVRKSGDTMTGTLILNPQSGLALNARGTISGSRLSISNNANISGALLVKGNVGVGTTNPGAALHVMGSIYAQGTGFEAKTNAGVTKVWLYQDQTKGMLNLYDGSQNIDVRLDADGPSYFNGGSVGIGASSPKAQLDVIGTISGSRLSISGNANISGSLLVRNNIVARSAVSGSSLFGFGLGDCASSSKKLTYNNSTGKFSCQDDLTAASGLEFSTAAAIFVNQSGDTMTGALVIDLTGGNSQTLGLNVRNTISGSRLIVSGNASVSGALIVRNNIFTSGTLSGRNLTLSNSASISGTLIVRTGITSKGSVSGSTIDGFGLGSCNGAMQRLLYNSTTDKFECGTISATSSFGTGNVLTIGDARYLRRSGGTMTGALVVDITGGNSSTLGLNVRHTISGSRLVVSGHTNISGSLLVRTSITSQGSVSGSSLFGFGLGSCTGSDKKLIYNNATGKFSCANDLTAASGLEFATARDIFVNQSGDTMTGALVIDLTGGNPQTLGLNVRNTISGSRLIISGHASISGALIVRNNIFTSGTLSGRNLTLSNSASISGTLIVRTGITSKGSVSGSTIDGFGLGSCNGGSQRLLYNSTTDKFECGTISASGTFGTGNVLTIGNARYVRKAGDTMTGALVINITGGNPSTLGLNVMHTISGSRLVVSGHANVSGSLLVRGALTSRSVISGSSIVSSGNANIFGNLTSLRTISGSRLIISGHSNISGSLLVRGALTSRSVISGASIVSSGNMNVWGNSTTQRTISGSRLIISGHTNISGALLVRNNITTRGTLSGYNLTVSRSASISGTLIVKTGITSKGSVSGSTIDGFGLGSCNGGSQRLLYNATTDKFECGTISAGASTFSTGNVLTIGDARYLRRSGGTMTGGLTITKGGGYYTGVLLNVRGTISGQALRLMGNGQSTGALILQNGGMTISKLTTNGLKTTLFAVDGMALNQLDGGAFFGRVGLTQNHWNLASSGATTWIARDSSRSWNSIAMSSDGRFQTATVSSGNIYTSSNFGVTWVARDSARAWTSVTMSADGKVQAATVSSGNIYTSTDYGVTWTSRATIKDWGHIAMSSDGKIITATITGCGKYTSTDYGVTWPTVPGVCPSDTINGVAMSSDGKVQTVVGDDITGDAVSRDYGQTWQAISNAFSHQFIAMSSDGRYQLTGIFGGTLLTSSDYGVTWSARDATRLWNGGAMSSDGRIQFATVSSGRIYRSDNYGVSWSPVDSSRSWNDIAISSDGKIQSATVSSGNIYTSYGTSYEYGNVAINTQVASGALTVLQTSNLTGAFISVNSTTNRSPVLVLENNRIGTESPHIMFGYNGTFDVNMRRSAVNTLAISGSVIIDNTLTVQVYGAATATTVCRSGTGMLSACSSSLRYKEDVLDLDMGLNTIRQMNPVNFKWKNRDERDFGFIAEEMEAINPLLVEYDSQGQVQGVKYMQLSAILTNAVQTLDARLLGITNDSGSVLHARDLLTSSGSLRVVGFGTFGSGILLNTSYANGSTDVLTVKSNVGGTGNTVFRINASGAVYSDSTFNSQGADYAEWFKSPDTDLKAGDLVCVDILQNNSVRKCVREGDPNLMGIISTNPAFIGNNIMGADGMKGVSGYVLVGLIGQVPAKVNTENGPVRPGDSLTSASVAGFARKAKAGESTVGVALEGYDGTGKNVINVLISRRNQSLSVESVEQKVLDSIASMNLSDEIQLMVQSVSQNLDLDDRVTAALNDQLAAIDLTTQINTAIDTRLAGATLTAENLTPEQINRIASAVQSIASASGTSFADAAVLIDGLSSRVLRLEAAFSGSVLHAAAGHFGTLTVSGTASFGSGMTVVGNSTIGPVSISGTGVTIGSLVSSGSLKVMGPITVQGLAEFLGDVHIKGELMVSKRQAGFAVIAKSGTSVTIIFETPLSGIPAVNATPQGRVGSEWWIENSSMTGFTLRAAMPVVSDARFSWTALSSEDPMTVSGAGASSVASLIPFPVNTFNQPLSSDAVWNGCIQGRPILDSEGHPLSCARYHDGFMWQHPDLGISFTYNPNNEPPILILPQGYIVTPTEAPSVVSSSQSSSSESSVSSSSSSESSVTSSESSSSESSVSSSESSSASSESSTSSSASSEPAPEPPSEPPVETTPPTESADPAPAPTETE